MHYYIGIGMEAKGGIHMFFANMASFSIDICSLVTPASGSTAESGVSLFSYLPALFSLSCVCNTKMSSLLRIHFLTQLIWIRSH